MLISLLAAINVQIRVALLESQDRLLELNRLGSGVETEKENSSGEGKTSDDDRMQAYTKLFISYNDTLDAIRTERKKLEVSIAGGKCLERMGVD